MWRIQATGRESLCTAGSDHPWDGGDSLSLDQGYRGGRVAEAARTGLNALLGSIWGLISQTPLAHSGLPGELRPGPAGLRSDLSAQSRAPGGGIMGFPRV